MSDNLPMTVPAPISPAQSSQIVNLLRRTARAEILPRFRTLSHAEVDTKSGPEDLVTEADRAAEAMIARGLRQMFPGALIVGEEAAADDPEIIGQVDAAQLAFAIDPVDGTSNFVFGLSTFGVILSATRFGVPVFGLLYDPVMDDWIMAKEHGPALYYRAQMPARRLMLPDQPDKAIDEMVGYLPFYLMPKAKQAEVARTYTAFRRINSLRCSCHEFRTLALGHVDFVLSARPSPWDHAAGMLIAQRAGGYAAPLDGGGYTAGRTDGVLLAARDRSTWTKVAERFTFLLAE